MGIGHSREDDPNDNSLQPRRRCFWCQNGRSFDDFYEPAAIPSTTITTTTVVACSTSERVNSQQAGVCYEVSDRVKFREESSKHKEPLEEPSASFAGPSVLAKPRKASKTSGSQQQLHSQQNKTTASGNRKFRDDTSDNSFPYSHFTHETLMQIIRCFPFPSPRTSPEPSPSPGDHGLSYLPSRSCDVRQLVRQKRVGHLCGANDEKKCRSTNPAPVPGRSIRKSSGCKMIAVSIETQKGAVEKLALVSADTMAITALPLDCWLKERLKNWVQLSGHEGTIVPATDQTLWKRRSCNDYNEGSAYRALMNDPAVDGFVPRYYREVEYKNESFIEIEDLTALFDNPAIMDIKMGTRTFLESEVQNTARRNDLYAKMVAQNPDEPTEEEHAAQAVTKMRYMQFREKESSTATLGFRIEAAKMPGGVLQKSFKKVRTREDVRRTLSTFFDEQISTVGSYILQRLKILRDALEKSLFFRTHEVVGSSLLLMYDSTDANVWMIDFAKSLPVEIDSVNHRREWVYGNHEDGYLKGLDNLIEVMEELVSR